MAVSDELYQAIYRDIEDVGNIRDGLPVSAVAAVGDGSDNFGTVIIVGSNAAVALTITTAVSLATNTTVFLTGAHDFRLDVQGICGSACRVFLYVEPGDASGVLCWRSKT